MAEIGEDPFAAVLDAEPVPVAAHRIDLDDALRGHGRLHRSEVAVPPGHSTGVAVLAAGCGQGRGDGRCRCRSFGSRRAGARRRPGRRAQRDLGPPRSAQRRPVGTGSAPPLPQRTSTAPLRLLAHSPRYAARHHERVDGSGYHRGESGEQLALSCSTAGGGRRLPRHGRGPTRIGRRSARPTPLRKCSTMPTRVASVGSRSMRCSRRPGRSTRPPNGGAGRPASPSARSTCCG